MLGNHCALPKALTMKPEQLEKFRERLVAERDSVVVEVKAHSGSIASATDEVEEAIVESDENLLDNAL